ncbi:PREDICTED: DNA-directed DNA/RNA polymerase mu isoform X2 [Crocodylus porosus]|uniref:DNA-directed DNA/RNA polymerase mu n=1 Tax=Crocodylus porosus TaxID=8502 RepID=A0A7M4DVI1_CROPO|nr:PREDICTED: DNA-directed DNA/RNA polymerase mu isoform X2 [Crocodylus porosus]XP_019401553.1 PREDICTED: DNA-directed DNA/RNA polymerase mu isoform X2 [Crocodylus porosus]XP_019401554.1 PREDICTED: DNA-directed DNA/RNA polymerase mu isoform X2 [Crocodylus porosus]
MSCNQAMGIRVCSLNKSRADLTQLRPHPPPSAALTHVVAEQLTGDEAAAWLARERGGVGGPSPHPAMLDLSWLTESISAGQPVPIEPRHRLQVTTTVEPSLQVAPYACQRRTPLDHPHSALVMALETLAEAALFEGEEARGLAFTRAASVLRCLPRALRGTHELSGLPGIGAHSHRVLQEVLEDGVCVEVETVKQSERYQTMKLFTQIFGVGVRTADRWYREGLRSLGDLRSHGTRLTREQQAGVQYFEDLAVPVGQAEAESLVCLVLDATAHLLPNASVTLAGGFRRGKPCGHDVDLLLSHPEEGREVGLLGSLVAWLGEQDLLLYQHSSYSTAAEASSSCRALDRFDRCFTILRLVLPTAGTRVRAWRAVRLDLVVVPHSQLPFALLGWTGSRHFERELRRFARHEREMVLNSHGLYDMRQGTFLLASSEEEIFQHLGLDYIPPTLRNA